MKCRAAQWSRADGGGAPITPVFAAHAVQVIRSFRHDPGQRNLHIEFQSGRRYIYKDVPPESYAALKAAFTKGEFFNDHIRDQYSFTRGA
jgi:hypothetical protein